MYTEDLDVLNSYLRNAMSKDDIDVGFWKECKELKHKKGSGSFPRFRAGRKYNKPPRCEIGDSPLEFTCYKGSRNRHALCLCTENPLHQDELAIRTQSRVSSELLLIAVVCIVLVGTCALVGAIWAVKLLAQKRNAKSKPALNAVSILRVKSTPTAEASTKDNTTSSPV